MLKPEAKNHPAPGKNPGGKKPAAGAAALARMFHLNILSM
jgi:hypothetical protein